MHSARLSIGLAVAGGLVVAAAAASADAPADHPAARSLSRLAEEVSALTALPETHREQRSRAIRRILQEYFNLPLIGRAVLGHRWRSITEPQKEAYQQAFEVHTVQLVNAQLDRIADGSLTILRTVPRNERETFVYTHFRREGDSPLEVQWRFRNHRTDGEPRIVDVAVEGVSLFATKRQDFAAIVETAGVDGLIAALRTMNETAR